MQAAGIWEDYQVLLSNAGLDNFLTNEPAQFAKLPMDVVQDFQCNLSSANPMVQYKIYNHTIDLPLANFCAAIRVPQWGSCEKIRGKPELLMNLYKELCGDRSFTSEDGKIISIHLPAIRYFVYYLCPNVLGRGNTINISHYQLAFLDAALNKNTKYNLGAIVARCLAAKGPIYGGTIASRILAYFNLHARPNDVPLARRDLIFLP